MLKMNLQLFAHKKLMDSSYWQETSCTDSAVLTFILATT